MRVEAANVGRIKPKEVVRRVNERLPNVAMTQNLHTALYKVFDVRPANGADDPFETNTKYCIYDEPHKDYVYQDAWVDFLVHIMQTSGLAPKVIRQLSHSGKTLNVTDYQ